jgi:hypothetical protein
MKTHVDWPCFYRGATNPFVCPPSILSCFVNLQYSGHKYRQGLTSLGVSETEGHACPPNLGGICSTFNIFHVIWNPSHRLLSLVTEPFQCRNLARSSPFMEKGHWTQGHPNVDATLKGRRPQSRKWVEDWLYSISRTCVCDSQTTGR